jgi:hypothetical protein
MLSTSLALAHTPHHTSYSTHKSNTGWMNIMDGWISIYIYKSPPYKSITYFWKCLGELWSDSGASMADSHENRVFVIGNQYTSIYIYLKFGNESIIIASHPPSNQPEKQRVFFGHVEYVFLDVCVDLPTSITEVAAPCSIWFDDDETEHSLIDSFCVPGDGRKENRDFRQNMSM